MLGGYSCGAANFLSRRSWEMPQERKHAALSGAVVESSQPILCFLATAGSSAPSDPGGGVFGCQWRANRAGPSSSEKKDGKTPLRRLRGFKLPTLRAVRASPLASANDSKLQEGPLCVGPGSEVTA